MRPWYDDIDTATLQRIKTYSAFNDAESKNLMVQTMYEYKQEEIAELEKENAELRAKESFVGDQNRKLCEQQQKIEVLEAENAELKEKLKSKNCIEYLAKGGYVKFLCENGNGHDQLTKAKELLKKWVELYKPKLEGYPITPIQEADRAILKRGG